MLAFMLILLFAVNVFTQDTFPSSTSCPSCTLTYKPFMPPQHGPTSTVYKAIMTTYYNIIDCRYCTVVNDGVNLAAKGPFTTRVTSDMLTVSAVGCMPETSASTRGSVQAYAAHMQPKAELHGRADILGVDNALARYPLMPRQLANPTEWNFTGTTTGTSSGTPTESPTNTTTGNTTTTPSGNSTQLSGQSLELFTQLNTALFAMDLINTPGVDLAALCRELRTAALIPASQLDMININAQQAADIVCFASVYGTDFNVTTPQLIGQLAAAIYAVEIGANYTGTTNASRLCDQVDYSNEGYLGINSTAVSSYICQATSTSTVNSTLSPVATVATTTVLSVTAAWSLTAPTGGEGPYANSTSTALATSLGESGAPFPSSSIASTVVESSATDTSTSNAVSSSTPNGTTSTSIASTDTVITESAFTNPPAPSTAIPWTIAPGTAVSSGTFSSSVASDATPSIVPYANMTSSPNVTGTGVAPSPYGNSTHYGTETGTAGTVAPSAGSALWNISFASTQYGYGPSAHTPFAPTSPRYYPAWTTSTTTAAEYRAY